jgi:signal transduction histidine kinase/CheY-like chemotaxis protein
VKQQIPLETMDDVFRLLFQLLNVICTVGAVNFWLSKRDRTNVEFTKTIEELKAVEQSKDDFLANVSHEIRTPINTICGMSEVVLQENDIEKMRENVRYIQTAGRNLMSVVSNVLDFSELQSGKIRLEEESYNITSTINDIINMTLAKIEQKRIELVVDCDATIPCNLLGDEKKIRRVIMNVVDNAIKFTEEGCVSIHIGYRKEEYGINLIITVKDTGIGMKAESLEKLFTSFSQVDTRRNRQKDGVGLGLAISQIIVRMMGGVINIKSKFGKETTVKFVIPQKVLDERPIARLEHKEKVNIGIYIDMEQFRMMEIRDEYATNIRHMVEQMQVRHHVCRNLSELKRRHSHEKFAQIFISLVEYKQDPEYFDELSLNTMVIVILFRSDEKELSNPNLFRIYKPFYVIPIVLLFNEQMTGTARQHWKKKGEMTAPDAHILVVDDNLMNLKVMEGILAKYQIKVSTVISGKEALEKIENKSYDLVFMDHMMPEMDGVETLHQLRGKFGRYFETVPVVALTANAIAGAREMFLAEGFTDFLEKPVENSVLERVLIRNLPKEKVDFIEEQKVQKSLEEKPEKVAEAVKEETPVQAKKPEENKFSIGDLDVEKGMVYCGGQKQYLEILKITAETARENQMQVEELFQRENWKDYTIMVHGIKSSMLSIGALKLSELAKKLEMAGKENNITYIRENHSEMLEEYKRVEKLLKGNSQVCPQAEEEIFVQDFPVLEDTVFDRIIVDLEEAMYALDEKRMLELINELQKYQYNGIPLYKATETVIRKVKMSDYMSAVETVSKLKTDLQKKRKGERKDDK